MRRLRHAMTALGLAGVLFGAAALAHGEIASADPEDSIFTDTELLQRSIEFRETFGIRSDVDYVRSIVNDPSIQPSDTWGVPLTPAEQADLDARLDMEADVEAVERYASQSADDAFAGAYIDQDLGGIIYVGFTTDRALHEKAVRDLLAGSKLRFFAPRFTLAELDGLNHEISYAIDDLERDLSITSRRLGRWSTGTPSR